jgi:hypothetical protein
VGRIPANGSGRDERSAGRSEDEGGCIVDAGQHRRAFRLMPQFSARFLLTAVIVLLWPVASWAAPSGTVIGLSGGCTVEHGGARGPAALAQGVEIGDTVEVAAGGKLKLRMADGSVVSVASGTKMTVTAYGLTDAGQRQDAKLSLSQGLLRLEVTPTTGTPAPFEVDTAVGTSAVRSTDWFVETQPGWMQVSVMVGSVAVTGAATGTATTLSPRQGIRLEAGRVPAGPRAVTTAEFNRLIARTALPQPRTAPRQPKRTHGTSQSPNDEYVPPPGGEYASPPMDYAPPPSDGGYTPPPGGGYGPPPGGGYMPPRGGYTPPGRGYVPGGGGGYRPPVNRGAYQ